MKEIRGVVYDMELEIEAVKKRADELGYSEARFNRYEYLVKRYNQFQEQGLTPVILYNSMLDSAVVSSQELMDGKFN